MTLLARSRTVAVGVLVVLGACGSPPDDTPDQERPESAPYDLAIREFVSPPVLPDERPSGARAFDFLYGRWHVTNRYLLEPLSDSNEWRDWAATLTVVPILGGRGNVDRYVAHPNGTLLKGYSIRVFNPDDDAWSISWVDTNGLRVRPQVVGTMGPESGTFYGEEERAGRTVEMRFLWSHAGSDRARWEQAYRRDDGTWETNWIMEFERR